MKDKIQTILTEADRIKHELRVCGITEDHIGDEYRLIGEVLDELANALGDDANFSATMTEELAKKATKAETMRVDNNTTNAYPMVNNTVVPNQIMYYNSKSSYDGVYAMFGTSNRHGFCLQSVTTNENQDTFYIRKRYAPMPAAGQDPTYDWGERYELLHSGNTEIMNIHMAGRINETGTAYTRYVGITPYSVRWSGTQCTITHHTNTSRYMVTITPLGGGTKSYTLVSKSTNDCVIQFSIKTSFEIKIEKY